MKATADRGGASVTGQGKLACRRPPLLRCKAGSARAGIGREFSNWQHPSGPPWSTPSRGAASRGRPQGISDTEDVATPLTMPEPATHERGDTAQCRFSAGTTEISLHALASVLTGSL